MPPTSRTKEEQKGLTLLALDSGRFESLNGLSQLFILDEILRTYEYDNELDDNSVKVHEVFDLIVGTGTGGLVACMVGPLDMTIQEAIEAYRFIHRSVFVEPSPGPLTVDERERRLSLALREIVQRQLGEAGLSKKFTTICPQRMIALTAMHANNLSRPMAFRTYRARRGRVPDCTIIEAIQATLSHPDHFPPVVLGSPPQIFVSTAAGHCNPIDSLYAETISTLHSNSLAGILSIGTGRPRPVALEGPTPLATALAQLSEHRQGAHDRFAQLFSSKKDFYMRLEVDNYDPSDEITEGDIMAHSSSYTSRAEIIAKLNSLADTLNARPAVVKVSDIQGLQLGGLDRVHQELIKVPDRSSLFDAVSQLAYAHASAYNSGRTCYPGTRLDILSRITEWMEQRSGSHVVLWIDGPLGAGKSALAHSVSKEASDKGFLASSFFMTPGSNAPVSMDQKSSKPLMGPPSIDNLVSTLIRDLAGKSDLFRDAVVKKLNEIPRFLTASPVVQLEHLLFPFVSSLSSDQRLLWVIDGFDELTRHERKDFSIYEVLDCLIQHASELRPYLMIFITARPFRNNPVEKLAAAAAHPDILWIPLDLSSRANASDLDIIAHQELTWLAQRNPSFECPDLHDPLTMAFRSRAGGLPLWLKVTRNFLERSFTPRRDLEQLVYDRALISPEYQQRINEMYAHVISETLDLRTSANQHHLRHVVFVLLAVQGPISPRTLNELFTGDSELPAEAVRSVLQCLRPLLLGLDNNHPIEFVHLSVRDFFQTSPTFGDLVQAPLSPRDLRKGHSMLLLRSFTVMAKELHAVASPDGLLSDSETLDQPLSPAAVPWGLQYGSSFWTQHILQVDPDFRSQDVRAALDDFFQEDFKDWLPLHAAIGKFKFTDKFIDDLKNVNDSWHGIAYKSLCNNSHAFLLDLVGQQLGDLDRLDERHQAQSQAVKSWRLLNQSKDGRGTYASELVNSLFRFSLAQTDIRLYDDAISMAEEAKTLSSQQPMERSMSLRVLSACLGAAGRWREALPPIVEAIRIQRSLLSTQVKEQHYLAKPLNYLSECSYRLGRSLAPITAAKEARKIYKRLSKEGAQSFTKDLASTASQLHILFHSRHQNYHALGAGKEAIRLYKQLAEKKPQKFNIFLAKELTGHALDLEMLERYRDALPHAEEAIRLFREMTSAETPWDHELAVALFLLARLRKELDPAPTAALEAVREAITLGERVMQSGGNESWKVISPKMWWWLLQSLELGVLLETKSLILEWEKEWERKNMVFWITSQHKPWLKEGGRFATWALKRLDRESKGRVSPWINRVLQLRKEFEDTEQKEESRVVRVDGNSDSSTSEEEEHNETDSDEREAASILPPIQDPDSDASSVAPPPIPEPDSSAEEGPPGPVPVEADTEESDDWASSSESLANAEEMRTSNESSSDEEVIYPAPDHLRPPPDNDEFWFSDEEEREEEERKKTVGLMRVEASWYAPSLKSPNLPTLRSEIRQSLQYGPSWNKGKNKGKLTHGLQRTDTTRTFSLYSNF